jgi:hypothetical protein
VLRGDWRAGVDGGGWGGPNLAVSATVLAISYHEWCACSCVPSSLMESVVNHLAHLAVCVCCRCCNCTGLLMPNMPGRRWVSAASGLVSCVFLYYCMSHVIMSVMTTVALVAKTEHLQPHCAHAPDE